MDRRIVDRFRPKLKLKRMFRKLTPSRDAEQYLLLTDVSFNLVTTGNGRFNNLKELCIHGLPESENSRCFELEETGAEEGAWTMRGCIDFPASLDSFVMALKNENEEIVSQMRFTNGRRRVAYAMTKAFRPGSVRMVKQQLKTECGTRIGITFTESIMGMGEATEELCELGYLAHLGFQETNAISDITEAISLQKRALEITSDTDPDLAGRLAGLGSSLYARFQHTEEMADLNEAVLVDRRALENTPEGHPDLADRLFGLGSSLFCRFERVGEPADLDEAISFLEWALEITPSGHPKLPQTLAGLGTSIYGRFQRTGEVADLHKAISLKQMVLETSPDDHPDLSERLVGLSSLLYVRFQRIKDLEDLNEAIALDQRALKITPDDHPELADRLQGLGTSLYARFQSTGQLADLDESIRLEQRALNMTPEERYDDLSSRLASLGASFFARFQHIRERADLNQAISLYQKALEITPCDHADLAGIVAGLGSSIYVRFQHTWDPVDLDQAMLLNQRALEITPDGHPDLADRLAGLGFSTYGQFQRLWDPADLDRAILLMERALEITPNGHHYYLPQWFTSLGTSYHARFQRTRELADLQKSISSHRRSLEIMPDDHPTRAHSLCGLGSSLHARFQRAGDPSDLEEAISLKRKALEVLPNRHPELADMLANLGTSLHASSLYLSREPADLEEAISLMQDALDLTPDGHPTQDQRLANLGSSFYARFQRTGDSGDLDKSISLSQKALAVTPDGHPDLADMLVGLGSSRYARFQRLGELNDLDKAISVDQRALDITPSDHPDLANRLIGLSSTVFARFQRLGEPDDLNKAILLDQRALEVTPQDHPDLAHRLSQVGVTFYTRFQSMGDLADINEAVLLIRRGLEATLDSHPDLARRLANLAASLLARFQHIGRLGDLDEAVALDQRALESTPDGHPDLAVRLSSLSIALYTRFRRSKEPADLDKAVSLMHSAVNCTPDDHPDMAQRLADLGSCYRACFQRSGKQADLDEAISLTRKALDAMPTGHPNSPEMLLSLGLHFSTRSSLQDGLAEDISTAVAHLKDAATSIHGQHTTRLAAAKVWAQTLQLPHSPEPHGTGLLEAFDTALSLLGRVADLGQTLQNRYSALEGGSGIALDAASAAIAAGRMDKALQWLEQGRCLVWGQLNNLRAPLDELRSRDSVLANRIATVSKLLDNAGSSRLHSRHGESLAQKVSLEDEARRQHALVKERDNLVAQARALPGFESFYHPPSHHKLLRSLPVSGYVVVINVHVNRQDLNATVFECETAIEQDRKTWGFEPQASRPVRLPNTPIATLLRSLWIDLVDPIFRAIGFNKPDLTSGNPFPRVWWCPTGILSFLPIHAAGVYDGEKGGVSALDYAIPSYTPTITSLANRFKNERSISKGVSGLLMTSQPNPGLGVAPSIPGTRREVCAVYERTCEEKVRALMLEGSEVSIETYLQQIERFSSIHLACHGSQEANDPLASRFLFHDGSLELREIVKKDLRHADLAFLSACQTSTGEEKLADEAVHLAAGMLAAGYRRVVATMWSIRDKEAPRVAQDFYDYIFDHKEEDDMGGFDGSLSAEALHYAIQRLRSRLDNSDRSLLAWAPYVHWGY